MLKKIFLLFCMIIFSFFLFTFLKTNHLLIGTVLIIGIIFIIKKYDIKHFLPLLIIASFSIRLISIFVFNVPQTSDFSVLLKAAMQFSIGDYSFSNESYFSMWAYQTGFVIYEGLILKIINSEFFLKLLNIIYEVIINVLIYKISLRLVSKKSSEVVSILYAILPFSLYYGTVLCNNHLSSCLFIVSIYLLLFKSDKLTTYLIAGFLLSVGNAIRPEGIVVIFSYVLYRIISLKKVDIRKTFRRCGILIFVYLLCNMVSSNLVISLGINSNGLKNMNPLWKFVLGTNAESYGMYDTNDEVYLSDSTKELEIIKERVNSPSKIINLLEKKTYKFILTNDLSSSSGIYSDKIINLGIINISFTTLENIINGTNKIIYLFILIIMIFGCIINRRSLIDSKLYYFLVFFIVNYVVYMLIEIHPRYTYYMLINMFILAGLGIDKLFNMVVLSSENSLNKKKS